MLHFSLFGKDIIITIPRHVAPVESGRGIIWEDAMLTSQSAFSLPATPKSMISTAENTLVSLYRSLIRPQLTSHSRTIIVERPAADVVVVADPPPQTDVDEDSMIPTYTEGTIHPVRLRDKDFTDEDTYHMGFGRAPEECTENGDFQEKQEEPF